MQSPCFHTRVHGARVHLQPFIPPFVQRYHAWMSDPWLRAQTSSERLTLSEEYAMQASWVSDPRKATFIAFETSAAAAPPSPGVLLDDSVGMVGDVNLFLLGGDEEEEYRALAAAWRGRGAGPGGCAPSPPPAVAEIMVMIGEPSARRRGLAEEAVRLMMEWGRRHLHAGIFVAKISEGNVESLALFTKKLGFVEVKRVAAFEEVHLVSMELGAPAEYREEEVRHEYGSRAGD